MNVLKKILIFLLALVIIFLLTKNFIIKQAIQIGGSAVTGFTVKVDKFTLGLFSTKIQIKGLKVLNPKEFEERVFVDLPELTVDYALMDIIGGNIHIEQFILNLQEVTLTRNNAGILNIDTLKGEPKEKAEKEPQEEAPEEPKEKKESKPVEFQVDYLHITIGKIQLSDYSKDAENPKKKSFDFSIDKEYENLNKSNLASFASSLGVMITTKSLKNGLVAQAPQYGVKNIDKLLGNVLGGALGGAGQLVGSAGDLAGALGGAGLDQLNNLKDMDISTENAEEVAKKTLGALAGIGSSTGDSAKDAANATVDSAKNVLKGLGGFASKLSSSDETSEPIK